MSSFQEEHGHQFVWHPTIDFDGIKRGYWMYAPTTPKVDNRGRQIFLLCFDGLTMGNRMGLQWTNRVNEIAEKYGFYAVYPVAQKRFALTKEIYYNNVWNALSGMARYRKKAQNDAQFVLELKQRLGSKYGPSTDHAIRWVGIGMSMGAQFVHVLAHIGLVDDVVSVSGTWLADQLDPQPGVNLVAFSGDADPLTLWDGGFGADWKRRLLSLPVLKKGLQLLLSPTFARGWSQPKLQALRYVQANPSENRLPVPDSCDHKNIYRRFTWGIGDFVITQYLIFGGGHTWHGRLLVESEFSGKHGAPLPPEVFDTNEIWVAELGLNKVTPA